jgi:hypothetical protein
LKDTSDEGVASAEKIMRVIYPDVSDEELRTKDGENIGTSLQALQKGFNVTADFEQRVLSFEEVKKELDSGKIVGFDGWTESSDENPESVGHALSIVGYVLPSDGDTVNHTPYYEVWNPWWKKTMYVSTKATGVRLAGMEFKWKNSWHNYRQMDSRSLPKIDEKLFDMKAPQFGNPVMWRGSFGAYYGYDSTPPKTGRRVMRVHSYNTLESKPYYDTPEAEVWRNDVNGLNEFQGNLRKSGVTLAVEVAILSVTGGLIAAGVAAATIIQKILTWFGAALIGSGVAGEDNLFAVASMLYNYEYLKYKAIDDAERCYFAEGPL